MIVPESKTKFYLLFFSFRLTLFIASSSIIILTLILIIAVVSCFILCQQEKEYMQDMMDMKIQDMNCLSQEGGISRQAIEEALKELDDCEMEGVGGPGGGGRGGLYGGFMGGDPNDDQAANGGMMKSVHDEDEDDEVLAIQGADHTVTISTYRGGQIDPRKSSAFWGSPIKKTSE